jgi:hypothetical protein
METRSIFSCPNTCRGKDFPRVATACATPHSPGEVSSPNPSATAPADRPALPEDRQPLPDSCRNTTDHVSDVISGTAGRGFPLLTNRFGSGFATTTRVSPVFSWYAVLQTG